MLTKLDFDTFCMMLDAVDEHGTDWTHKDFRDYRHSLGVERETLIPSEYALDLLDYRYAEYNPSDYGMDGKFSEVSKRISLLVLKNKPILWNEFSAHKSGRADYYLNGRSVEHKSGGGDWLESKKNHTIDAIIREYSKKTSLIHWDAPHIGIDILCKWSELFEYLSHYRRAKNGPELGAAIWFKSYVKPSNDGDRWIVEIQNYTTSEKKLAYIKACPFNRAK